MYRHNFKLKSFLIAVLIVFSFGNIQSQSTYDNLITIPANPQPGQNVKIEYQPIESDLIFESDLKGVVFFNKVGTTEPRAVEIKLCKNVNMWHGTFTTENDDVSFLIVFYDSVGNIDNYKEQGYWRPLFNNEKPLPGSKATIAHMYCGAWPASIYRIGHDKDAANQLYKDDFNAYPDLKRIYYRYYIESIRFDRDPDLFLHELTYFSQLSDLTEWELWDISKKYDAINDNASSEKYSQLIFDKYPVGCWATQTSSLDFQKKLFATEDFMTLKSMYADFKIKYSDLEDECAKRYIVAVEINYFLKRLIEGYIKNGMFQEWKQEAEKLGIRWKFLAYALGAKTLNEKSFYPEISETLATEASEWLYANLDSGRVVTDRLFNTDREVRESREIALGECLGSLGHSLLLQGKNEEALPVLKRAVSLTKRKEQKVNLHYIESLVATNNISEAIHEIEKIGELSPQIMEIYQKIISSEGKASSFRMKNKDTNQPLKNSLISERSPSFEITDSLGSTINIKDYRGKIVVLDFWATWCAPCIAGFENMSRLVERYKNDQNIVFLFINTQEKGRDRKMKANQLVQSKGYDFILRFDEHNKAGSVFNFSALPTKIIIDKEGNIRYRESGSGNGEEDALNTVIDALNK